jgi:hypothetical protein
LAGIIDTDGSVHKNSEGKRVIIIQTRETLTNQIVLLARSLGFNVNCHVRPMKNVKIFGMAEKDYKDQYIINISGESLDEIPTLLPRKKCKNISKNRLRTNVKINHIGKGIYYGWEVDENHRFLLADTTVLKNCNQMWCVDCHTAFDWRTGRIEHKIHNPHYYEWMRRNSPNGEIPRNPEDNPAVAQQPPQQNCRVLDHNTASFIGNVLRTSTYHDSAYVPKLIRGILHMNNVELPRYNYDYVRNNQELRVKYMRNMVDEDRFKVLVQQQNKKHEKKKDMNDVLVMFTNAASDIMLRIHDDFLNQRTKKNSKINMTNYTKLVEEYHELCKYADNCFQEISSVYKSKKYVINDFMPKN